MKIVKTKGKKRNYMEKVGNVGERGRKEQNGKISGITISDFIKYILEKHKFQLVFFEIFFIFFSSKRV